MNVLACRLWAARSPNLSFDRGKNTTSRRFHMLSSSYDAGFHARFTVPQLDKAL